MLITSKEERGAASEASSPAARTAACEDGERKTGLEEPGAAVAEGAAVRTKGGEMVQHDRGTRSRSENAAVAADDDVDDEEVDDASEQQVERDAATDDLLVRRVVSYMAKFDNAVQSPAAVRPK